LLVLKTILKKLIRVGTLTIVDASGRLHIFSGRSGSTVKVHLHNKFIPWRMVITPTMAIGEGYMEGHLTVEDGTIYDFLSLLGQNIETHGQHPFHLMVEMVSRLFKRFQQFNPQLLSKKNVAHHYDLSQKLYELFLDPDLQYSCAYFESPETDLETAQENKKRHIAAKLMISPGQSVLDIGSGWGGLAIFLAKTIGARVTGITLSENQLEESHKKAKNEGLTDLIDFYLRDYRDQAGTFERIVSVGMFEHVGIGHFPNFFMTYKNLLADNGIALLHTIGRSSPPSVTDPWVRKYIFPGGYIPALSEVLPAIEKTGLIVTDVEILHAHYAETIRHWRARFNANRDTIKTIYDERFCRMWEFYLASSEVSFRFLGMTVFQIQMVKKSRLLPLKRDYIEKLENEM